MSKPKNSIGIIHGFPVVLDSDIEGGVETAYFPSGRRCPALFGKLKAIYAANSHLAKAAKRAGLAAQRLAEADEAATDAAAEAHSAAEQAVIDAHENLASALHDFTITGFLGAGYTQNEAARLAQMVPDHRLCELVEAAKMGASRLDFSQAGKG